jgi:hypothetical protein
VGAASLGKVVGYIRRNTGLIMALGFSRDWLAGTHLSDFRRTPPTLQIETHTSTPFPRSITGRLRFPHLSARGSLMTTLVSRSAIPGLLLVSFAVTGCSALKTTKGPSAKETPVVRATAASPAVRAMGLWQPGEGDGLDGTTGRGFVGQIYFFNANSPSPIAVDGDVRVFVFDDVGTPEEQKTPLHQFDFNDGAWQGYETTSALGPCYNIYVPYTRKGLLEADCSIRLRLTRPDGSSLFSEMTAVHLQGVAREDSVARRLRTTPEYDLNAPTQREWQGQATTLGVQKNGRLERVSNDDQSAAASYFRQSRGSEARQNGGQLSQDQLTPSQPQSPGLNQASDLNQQEQIRALEQKLIELQAKRNQSPPQNVTEPQLTPPRQFDPPSNAQQAAPQAQFRQLSSTRHIPEVVEYADPAPASIQTLPNERQAPQRRADEATQARANELRALLEGN